LNVHRASDVRQIEIHTAEPLVPFEFEIAVAKLKRYKSPGIDQIPAELIQAGGDTSYSMIRKLISFIWNKEELPDQWKESVIYLFTRRAIKLTSNYRGTSLLSTLYKILSNVFLLRLNPYTDETTGDHQCGFRRNRSATDNFFCNRQIRCIIYVLLYCVVIIV
jgi:hypothetical protein